MKSNGMVWIFFLFFCISCCMNSQKKYPIDVQGHRGARAIYPENSIPGFIYALELGVTTLEMDVVITKDSQVVLSHEPWMSHEICLTPEGNSITESTEKNYNLYQMTYDEVKQFDCGSKPHPGFPLQKKMRVFKPLLSDVIDTVENLTIQKKLPPVVYNIETKCQPEGDNLFHPDPATFSELLMKVIREKGIANRVIIQSFDVRTLQHLHRNHADIKLALLIDEKTEPEKALNKLGFIPYALSPHYRLANRSLKNFCMEKNMRLIVWTVNDRSEAERLIELNPDGIISDNPEMIIDLTGKENVMRHESHTQAIR